MKATCGDCTTEWYGLKVAHCGSCHQTFSVIQYFDAHRSQHGPRGACLDPARLKHEKGSKVGQPLLRRDKRGFWVGFETRPEELNHVRASA